MIVSAGGGDEEPSDAPADLGVPTTTLEQDRNSDRTDTETETTDTETESAGGVTPAEPVTPPAGGGTTGGGTVTPTPPVTPPTQQGGGEGAPATPAPPPQTGEGGGAVAPPGDG